MRTLRVIAAFAVVVIGVVSTAGCSGGGGDDGFVLYPPLPNFESSMITVASAQDVAATVVRAADQMFDVTATIGGQVFPSPPAAPNLLSSNSKFDLFATVAMTGDPVTETCAVSGTVTVSGDPANNSVALAANDVFDLVFDACDDGDGYNIDGAFSLVVDEVSGDLRTDVFRLVYSVSHVDLTIVSGVETYTAETGNAGFTIEWHSLAFPVIALSNRPFYLRVSSQADVYSWPPDFGRGEQSLTVNADISIPTTVGEVRQLDLQSASLGGQISYVTVVPLEAPDGQDPESGEILVSEYLDLGTIRIVIESSASVRLDIDVDGDRTVDDIQYTTWAALRG